MNKKLAIISNGMLHSEPRVLMEINALKQNYDLILFGKGCNLSIPFVKLEYASAIPKIDFHFRYPYLIRKCISAVVSLYLSVKRTSQNSKENKANEKNERSLIDQKPDLILLHGIIHLPWVSKVIDKLKCPLIINMHEYYPLEFEDDPFWIRTVKPVYDAILKNNAKRASAFFVVCNTIIKEYEKFGLTNQILIRNAKPYYELEPILNSTDKVRMIHHGISNASRKIELTIECMKYLPENYTLDLMLVPDNIVYPKLKELAKSDARIKFLDPVPTKEISIFINAYDIGIFLLPPVNFNYLNALPNKLFEFIQARLAIVVSPNPEMKHLVEEYELGIVSKDYTAEEFAKAILVASKDIHSFKKNSDKAARIINDEEEQKKIIKEVDRLCAV